MPFQQGYEQCQDHYSYTSYSTSHTPTYNYPAPPTPTSTPTSTPMMNGDFFKPEDLATKPDLFTRPKSTPSIPVPVRQKSGGTGISFRRKSSTSTVFTSSTSASKRKHSLSSLFSKLNIFGSGSGRKGKEKIKEEEEEKWEFRPYACRGGREGHVDREYKSWSLCLPPEISRDRSEIEYLKRINMEEMMGRRGE